MAEIVDAPWPVAQPDPPKRDSLADVLEQHAAEAATSSRDFGRGYMHAVRVARDMDLDAKLRHHERQLAATELLILAGRTSDQDAAGVLIAAAVAISRRQVV